MSKIRLQKLDYVVLIDNNKIYDIQIKRFDNEIRKLAKNLLDELVKIAPSCFEDLLDEANWHNT